MVSFTLFPILSSWCQDPLTLLKLLETSKSFSLCGFYLLIFTLLEIKGGIFKHKAIASGTFQKTPLYTQRKYKKQILLRTVLTHRPPWKSLRDPSSLWTKVEIFLNSKTRCILRHGINLITLGSEERYSIKCMY